MRRIKVRGLVVDENSDEHGFYAVIEQEDVHGLDAVVEELLDHAVDDLLDDESFKRLVDRDYRVLEENAPASGLLFSPEGRRTLKDALARRES